MANYMVTDSELTSIADAIRTKGGTSEQLEFPDGFVDAVGAISGGGNDNEIPDGYQQVQYVELDGSCYAYVPLSLNASDIVNVSVTKKANSSNEEGFIGYPDEFEFYSSQSTSKVWPTSGSYDYKVTKVADMSKGSATTNTTFTLGGIFTSVGQLENIYIGVYNPNSYPFTGYFNGMSVLRIFNGVYTTYRKYVPVRRKSDDKAGIFEIKTSQFYPSVGNTEFVAGPDVT